MGQRLHMTVGRKLTALAGTGVLVALAIGIVTVLSLSTVRSASDERTVLNKANAALIDLDMQESNAQIAERDNLLATTEATRKAAADQFDQIKQTVAADWDALAALPLNSEVNGSLATLRTDYTTYLTEVSGQLSVLATIDPASPQAAIALQAESARADAMEKKITTTRDLVQQHVSAARAASDNAMSTLKTAIAVALVLGLAALVVISLLITRSITRPLQSMVTALGRVADRDLTTAVDVRSGDEIGQMATALGTALTSMREAVATVGETSSALAGASDELTAVATELGQA
uniref:HAMP domain-containing protein n=1 Tax=Actinoplanes subtropicus TaxID=543632 RepID=UPI0004C33A3A